MNTPSYDAKKERSELKIYVGTVTSVDQEKQMMTVSLSNRGSIDNIPINNSVSINGVGYRYCPIPYASQVILYDQNGILYHIGYVYNPKTNDGSIAGMSASTNNGSGDKNLLGSSMLQRNLSVGESSLAGIGGSEVYMAGDGSVYIFNSSMSKIVLDTSINAILVTTPTQYSENAGVVTRSGSVLRRTKGVANTLEPYYSVGGSITPLSAILESINISECQELSEFSVDVGVQVSDITGAYDEDSIPASARFSVADIVLDQAGNPIVHNGSFLKVLLEAVDGCGRLCIDENGCIAFIDTTEEKDTSDSVSFSPGDHTSFDINIEKTALRVYKNDIKVDNQNATMLISSTGAVHVSNLSKTSIDLDISGNVTISTCIDTNNDSKCTISIGADGTVSIKGVNGSNLVSAILGTPFLQWVKDFVVTHVHGTAMGPSDVSIALKGFNMQDFESPTFKHN